MHQFFQGNKWRSDWKIFKWISELKGLTKRFPKISVATWHILPDHFPILTVLLKRLSVCFGWGVRGGYSCSSYLGSIIFASSFPLRVPRPAILIVSSTFWVKNRYYHRAWVTCGLYGRHAFETSIVPADLSGPPSESFLLSDLPFMCIFLPPSTPPPPSSPSTHTYLECLNKRPGQIFDFLSREAWTRISII